MQGRDGWLHTGDLAARDENGCPREVLYTHPEISDVQVYDAQARATTASRSCLSRATFWRFYDLLP